MAAIRKAMAISSDRRVLTSLFHPPSRLISFRGIASKLFVGGKLDISPLYSPVHFSVHYIHLMLQSMFHD